MNVVVMTPEEMIALVNAGDGQALEIEAGESGEIIATAADEQYRITARVDEATGRVDVTRVDLDKYGDPLPEASPLGGMIEKV